MIAPGLEIAMNSVLCALTSLLRVDPQHSASSNGAPVFRLDEGTLLKIFGFLPTKDLIRASQVCKLWYRLSYDQLLWKIVDLRSFTNSLVDPEKFQAHVITRLATGKIRCLDLSGFVLSEGTLGVLATQCKELRVLKLKSVTFTADVKNNRPAIRSQNTVLFPKHLDCLDIRFSHGSPGVYRAIGKELSNVKWLGLCDAFFQAILANGELQATIDSMKNLRKLDLSHCLQLKDSTLVQFKRCSTLEVLSVRRCCFLTGTFVGDFLESCTRLKTLILDGISLDDDTLQNISWRYSTLKHLDLGWCPLITPTGLKSALHQIARIKTLEYLGLCAIGEEKALDDEILLELGNSLACWGCKKLKSLNVSRSRSLTQDGVAEFNKLNTSVELLDTADCPAIKTYKLQTSKELVHHKNGKVFEERNNSMTISGAEKRKRKGSISATQFARSKYTLETPL